MKRRRVAGKIATGVEEKDAMPAASARTPEPTMFFARLMVVAPTDAVGVGARLAAIRDSSSRPASLRSGSERDVVGEMVLSPGG